MKSFKEIYNEVKNKDDYLVIATFQINSIEPSIKKWEKNFPLKYVDFGAAENFSDEKSAMKAHDKTVKYIQKVYDIPFVKNDEDIEFWTYEVLTIRLNGDDITKKPTFMPNRKPRETVKATSITNTKTGDFEYGENHTLPPNIMRSIKKAL